MALGAASESGTSQCPHNLQADAEAETQTTAGGLDELCWFPDLAVHPKRPVKLPRNRDLAGGPAAKTALPMQRAWVRPWSGNWFPHCRTNQSQCLGRSIRSLGSPRRREGSGALEGEMGVWSSQGVGKDKLFFLHFFVLVT